MDKFFKTKGGGDVISTKLKQVKMNDLDPLKEKKLKLTPWIEKYRPTTIAEIFHQEHVVQSLNSSLTTGNVRI